jgi:Tfp pilus assembly protein PilV
VSWPSSRKAEGGETLLELLISVTIMSIAVVALVAGMGTTLIASDVHRQNATAETVLRSYAERLQDPTDVPYVACATTSTYSSVPGFSLPGAGWSASITTVLAWQGDTPPTFSSSCPSPDRGLQQLTLRVQSPAGSHQATETLVIVKRKA